MTTFYFVAGEQVVTIESRTVLDAWMKLAAKARCQPIASEFRRLSIEAYNVRGEVIAKRTWEQWDNEVLRDTYGDNYRAILDHAAELI